MTPKSFALVLHSHIPYVLEHGSWPHGMDWLYEAAAESYLPLLDVAERLAAENLTAPINISFTPVLAAQLKDPEFARGFDGYLRMKIMAAESDRASFAKEGSPLLPLTEYWAAWYRKLQADFHERYGRDIVAAFRSLQDRGRLEILTSAATHGYLPLLGSDVSVRHQVKQGCRVHRACFGKDPRGFWIPECAFRPGYSWKPPVGPGEAVSRLGVDEILSQEGLGYFFVDGHLLRGGEALGVYLDRFPGLKRLWERSREGGVPDGEKPHDPYSAYLAYPSRLPFFVRDEVSGSQVWSRHMGYPGDGWYLEFHKKHFPGGMRYWRITSDQADLAAKEPYEPEKVRERVEDHASHFVSAVQATLKERDNGIVVALYDTELFGHWWFEGPEWLYAVLKKLAAGPVRPVVAGEFLDSAPPRTMMSLPEGSWGKGGFHWIWLNEETGWIWEKIYQIEAEAADLDSTRRAADPRLLRQFYREKFLLESSDWPFLISTLSAKDYAENRAAEHFSRASQLAAWLKSERPLTAEENARLGVFEREDGLFEEVVRPDGHVIR